MTNANITPEIAQAYGLTLESLVYFARIASDAKHWDSVPLLDIRRGADEEKGYLTACKKASLIVTARDEWNGHCYPVWALFTERGAKLAAEIGYSVEASA